MCASPSCCALRSCVQPDNKKFNFAEAFLNEWIWTAILCYVVIVMLYTKEMEGNYAYGFSIGMTFTAAGVSAPISGGGLNPAMSFGLWFSSTFNKYSGNDCAENGWANMWYFLLAPIAGAFSAWLIHRITHEARWEQWHDVIMEFFGTFFLTYAMCTTIVAAGAGFISIGFLVAVLVYVGFHKKSGHYNPVVSLAVWINKGLEGKRFGFYCAAQCTAAFAAAIIGYLTTRYDNNLTDLEPYHPKAAANENKFGALLANFIFTSFVAFTYLVTMAQVHKTGIKANPFFGIIIGFSIMAGYGTVGNFTSSIFNPAIWLGSSLVYLFSEGGDDVGEIYIYAISGFGGAVAAAFFYKFFVGDPFEGTAFDSEEGQLERDREAMRAASSRRTGGGNGGRASAASSSGGAGGAGAGATVMTSNPVATAPADGKPANAAADSSV